MYLGEIMELGVSKDVYDKPMHPYSKALLSAVPLPDPKLRGKPRTILKGDVPSPLAKPSGCAFRTRCPLAQEVCKQERPPLIDVLGGRMVACHFVKPEAVKP
jgi:oligopeptide/dipeptide ABC transporter ATP-binding protein